jgi:hypothetical protein
VRDGDDYEDGTAELAFQALVERLQVLDAHLQVRREIEREQVHRLALAAPGEGDPADLELLLAALEEVEAETLVALEVEALQERVVVHARRAEVKGFCS